MHVPTSVEFGSNDAREAISQRHPNSNQSHAQSGTIDICFLAVEKVLGSNSQGKKRFHLDAAFSCDGTTMLWMLHAWFAKKSHCSKVEHHIAVHKSSTPSARWMYVTSLMMRISIGFLTADFLYLALIVLVSK